MFHFYKTSVLFFMLSVFGVLLPAGSVLAIGTTGTYTDWKWSGENYTDFEWRIVPNNEQEGPDAYFYSHQFGMTNGDGGYAGIQGDADGKRAIFSLWNALDARGPGIAKSFGGEGVGFQTIIPYPWIAGHTYAFKVARVSQEISGTWWGAWITDQASGQTSSIGQIKVPPTWGGLSASSVVWIERYGGSTASCNDIHYASADFTAFTANNGSTSPSSHNNHLAQPPGCPGSLITETSAGVRHEMGIGNPVSPIIQANTNATSVSDLTWSYASNGSGEAIRKNTNLSNHLLTLNGQRYAKGLGTHANSEIRYNLSGKYTSFLADVGVDDTAGIAGSVVFQVWVDGVKLFDSGIMTGISQTQSVQVDVRGKQELKLIVTDAGDGINFDHADWANARLQSIDTVPPIVSITSPANGATISDASYDSLSADASDNVGIAGVQFKLDGANIGAEDTVAPYSIVWNTSALINGSHTLSATARDTSGNMATSAPITVTVKITNVPADNLLAYYTFDEGSGTTASDSSGNGRTGKLMGGTAWTKGKYGNALKLDGVNDYVSISSPNDPLKDFTYTAWIRPDKNRDEAIIMRANTSGNNEFYLRIFNGKLRVSTNNNFRVTSASGIPTNTWTHVAVTRSGNTIRIYKNAVKDSNTGIDGRALDFGACPLMIGTDADADCAGSLGNWFDGKIDDIRVYNRALTAEEITALYGKKSATGIEFSGEVVPVADNTQNNRVPATKFTRQLDVGATGEDVSFLQQFLSTYNNVYPEGLITGYFGRLTASAVSSFQLLRGIPQAGRVGPMTLEKLNEAIEW